jgi:hypothetical protein
MKARPMTLNRNLTLTSLYGHSVRFAKGEAANVPPIMFAEALAIGAEFADGEGLPPPVETEANVPVDPIERDARILAAVLAIAERNDNKEFTASGHPKANVVSRQAGFEVSPKDVAKAWQRRADKIAEADEA